MKLLHTLLLLLVVMQLDAQECADGTSMPQSLHRRVGVVNSYKTWSSTKPRYKHLMYKRRARNSMVRRGGRADFPLERAAIIVFTGVGVGYLGTPEQQWVGLPAIAVSVAMPFPGSARNGQFEGRSKLLALFAYTVAYGVGLGVGQNLRM